MLGLFFGQPWRNFSISELIAEAGAGSGGVQRELKRLSSSGLVVATVGRQRRYQANPEAPVYAELCSIVRKTMGPADLLRAALEPLASQIEVAMLFGSVAKGTDTAHSDIDVLIVSDTLTLESVFGRRRDRQSPFVRNVLAGEYVVLWGAVNG